MFNGLEEMSQDIAGVYSDARMEYTKQLCTILVPSYFQFFLSTLEKAKEGTEPKKILWQFQTLLNDIPDWNMEKVSTEIAQIQSSCGCDYLEDLLTAVFIAHTKVLTAIRISSKQKRVQITVPKVEHFLFKVLCETSKLLWGSSYLFREGINSIEKQQNYRSIETLLGEGILQAVRQMVPVKNILRDFVSMEGDDDDEEEVKEDDKKDLVVETASEESKREEVKAAEEVKVAEEVKAAEEVKTEEVKAEEVKAEEVKAEEVKAEEVKKEEVKTEETPQIVIDTNVSRHVGFSDYNSVFDSSNPEHSDIVLDSQDRVEDNYNLDILDGPSVPLDMDDIESLDTSPEGIADSDYEVLV